LQLDLEFAARDQLHPWQWALVVSLLVAVALSLLLIVPARKTPAANGT
jgi:hypothetical protein